MATHDSQGCAYAEITKLVDERAYLAPKWKREIVRRALTDELLISIGFVAMHGGAA